MQFLKFLLTVAIVGIVFLVFTIIFGFLVEAFPDVGGILAIVVALFFVWLFIKANENEDFTNH